MHINLVDINKFRDGIEKLINAFDVPYDRPRAPQQPWRPSPEEVRRFRDGLKAVAQGGGIPLDHPILQRAEEAYKAGRIQDAQREASELGRLVRQQAQIETTPEHIKTEIESGIRKLQQYLDNSTT